jgi:hypothetical protein
MLYLDGLYNFQNKNFESYMKYLLSNNYGKIINSIILLSFNHIKSCGSDYRNIDDEDYQKLSPIQKNIANYFKAGSIRELNFDFLVQLYVEYSKYSIIQVNMTHDLNISNAKHSLYLDVNTPYIQDIESLQTLYYYCFYSMITYETPGQINALLPKTEKSKIIEDYIYHYNYDLNFTGDNIFKPKFFIYVDHIGLNIIIAIRGLGNAADTISFISGEMENPFCLERFSKESGYLAHKGFTLAACNVLESVMPVLKKWVSIYPDYNIKVTGHSYGAGVAALVAWALNEDVKTGLLKTNTSVRGILFGCPPVFNEEAVKDTCSFLVNVIFGWDIIPSISESNIYKFSCGVISNAKRVEKCFNAVSNKDKTIFCETYIPGTIFWLTYDEITREAQALNLIFKDNDRLQNIILHERMDNDQDIKLTFVYLLTLINKINVKL